jgi:transcriptional regulator with XRE-family HTH domain
VFELGLTDSETARIGGVSRRTISQIIHGQPVRVSTVSKVLKALEGRGHPVDQCKALLVGRVSADMFPNLTVGQFGPRLASDSTTDGSNEIANSANELATQLAAVLDRLQKSMRDGDLNIDDQEIDDLVLSVKKIDAEWEAISKRLKKARALA